VEPHGSNEPAPPAAAGDTPARGATWSLILVGIVGLCVGSGIVLTLVRVRADAPVEDAGAAVAAPASPTPEIESTPPPTWTGSRRARWANDGSRTIAVTLAATHDLPAWMSWARPTLMVRCQSRATDAFVALDTSAAFEADADRRTVRVQWDDDSASTQRWGVSESGRELFAPDGRAFVQRAATARRLRFGFTPFNASPVTADFAVLGFDQLAGLVAGACGWRLDAPQDGTS
jgi:hypothetical protein